MSDRLRGTANVGRQTVNEAIVPTLDHHLWSTDPYSELGASRNDKRTVSVEQELTRLNGELLSCGFIGG